MDPITLIKIWTLVKPIRRIRLARQNARRRKAHQPEIAQLDDQKENEVFPQGTMTKSGAIIALAGPFVTLALHALGVGDSCTPEQIANGCVVASELSQAIVTTAAPLVTAIGSIIVWKGYNRKANNYQ